MKAENLASEAKSQGGSQEERQTNPLTEREGNVLTETVQQTLDFASNEGKCRQQTHLSWLQRLRMLPVQGWE